MNGQTNEDVKCLYQSPPGGACYREEEHSEADPAEVRTPSGLVCCYPNSNVSRQQRNHHNFYNVQTKSWVAYCTSTGENDDTTVLSDDSRRSDSTRDAGEIVKKRSGGQSSSCLLLKCPCRQNNKHSKYLDRLDDDKMASLAAASSSASSFERSERNENFGDVAFNGFGDVSAASPTLSRTERTGEMNAVLSVAQNVLPSVAQNVLSLFAQNVPQSVAQNVLMSVVQNVTPSSIAQNSSEHISSSLERSTPVCDDNQPTSRAFSVTDSAAPASASASKNADFDALQTDAGYIDDADSFAELDYSPAYLAASTNNTFSFDPRIGGRDVATADDQGDFIDEDMPPTTRRLQDSSRLSSRSEEDSVGSSSEDLSPTVCCGGAESNYDGRDPKTDFAKDESRGKRLNVVIGGGTDSAGSFRGNDLNGLGDGRRRTPADDGATSYDLNRANGLSKNLHPVACSSLNLRSNDSYVRNNCGEWRESDAVVDIVSVATVADVVPTATVSNVVPTTTDARARATSVSSNGTTPSAPFVSPFGADDNEEADVLASVPSSPEMQQHGGGRSIRFDLGSEVFLRCQSSNDDGSNIRWPAEPAEPATPEVTLSFACRSCSSISDNMNQSTTLKHLEKRFDLDAEVYSIQAATPAAAAASFEVEELPGGVFSNCECHDCRRKETKPTSFGYDGPHRPTTLSSSSHDAISLSDRSDLAPSSNSDEAFLAERGLECAGGPWSAAASGNTSSVQSVGANPRTFSCQNLRQAATLTEFEGVNDTSKENRFDSTTLTNALSDDNLIIKTTTMFSHHHLRSRRRPPLLFRSSQTSGNGKLDCLECHRLLTSEERRLFELRIDSNERQKLSLSGTDDDDDDDDNDDHVQFQRQQRRIQFTKNNYYMKSSSLSSSLSPSVQNKDGGVNDVQRLGASAPVSEFFDKKRFNIKSFEKQVPSSYMTQSSCGATSVIRLLKALGVKYDDVLVCEMLHINRQLEKASLPEYLLSCSRAGTSAEQLISCIAELTKGEIYGKFFQFPGREIKLCQWLTSWMRRGAVPLATLKSNVDDNSSSFGFYHQLIHGVGSHDLNVYHPQHLTSESEFLTQLCQDSTRTIGRQSVVSRWRNDCYLNVLRTQADTRWQEMNVIGQVVNILREDRLQTAVGGYRTQQTPNVVIPTHFKSGITLFVRTDAPCYEELRGASSHLPPKPTTAAGCKAPPSSPTEGKDCDRKTEKDGRRCNGLNEVTKRKETVIF